MSEPERVWLLVGDLPCLGCGYNLRGLAGPVVMCPECGHANDLQDPTPWRVQQLPVGVIDRQHWPASAVALSFPLFLLGVWSIGATFVHQGFAVVAAGFFAVVAFFWGRECWKWVRSCRNTAWAVAVLLLLHVATWLVFVGIAGVWLIIENRLTGWLAILAFTIGAAGMYATAHLLRRGEYRQEARNWRLPTGRT